VRLLVWLCYILIATLTFLKFLNLQDIFLIKLQTIKGLIFNQTYLEIGPNKYEAFFKGKNFEEKEMFYFDMEDKEDPLYIAARNKIVLYWGLFSLNQATTPEDFAKVDERIKEDEAAELQEKIDLEKEAADLKAKEVVVATPASEPVPA
jgi:hypothetical protein